MTDLIQRVQSALFSRYCIERELGGPEAEARDSQEAVARIDAGRISMDPTSAHELEAKFAPTLHGAFMERYGGAERSAAHSEKKICVVATDKSFLIALLYEWSKRGDCYYVKYSVSPRDGMYLGRCFLTSDEAAGRLCREHKGHPKVMVTIQDDEFFNAYRGKGSPGRPE